MKVAVLIPAHNEAALILQTLSAVASLRPVAEILVIDDGSTDNTAALVKERGGAALLSLSENRGKGAALNAALDSISADLYLLLDADLGPSAQLGGELLKAVLLDQADMTVARLDHEQSSDAKPMGFGFARRIAACGVKALTGVGVENPLSGQRAVKAEVLEKTGGFLPGFGVEVGLTVGALHYGFRVQEIPLPFKHRAYGRGWRGFRHRGRQLLHILRALWLCWKKGWRKC